MNPYGAHMGCWCLRQRITVLYHCANPEKWFSDDLSSIQGPDVHLWLKVQSPLGTQEECVFLQCPSVDLAERASGHLVLAADVSG